MVWLSLLKRALSNLDCTHAYDSGGFEYIEVQNSSGAREMSDDSVLALQGSGPELIFTTQVKVLHDDLTGDLEAGESEVDRSLECTG